MTCTFLRIISETNAWWRLGNTGKPRLLATNALGAMATARTGSPTHRSISSSVGNAAPTSRHTPSCGWPSHSARKLAHASNGSRRVVDSDVSSSPRAAAASASGATTGTRTHSAVLDSAERNWFTTRA